MWVTSVDVNIACNMCVSGGQEVDGFNKFVQCVEIIRGELYLCVIYFEMHLQTRGGDR